MRVLAIDQGTTGTTAVLCEADGRVQGRAYREFPQHYPQPGWVEHDPLDIWRSVVDTVNELCTAHPGPIAAVGITNQRETTVLWDRRTGSPVHRAIVWQCRRTAETCLRLAPGSAAVRAATGLPIDAYFSATKLRWLLDQPRLPSPDHLAFGTVDTWLIRQLTGGDVHATDPTNASRTLLYNIHTRRWDPDLCARFGIPGELLPEVRPSRGSFGEVSTIPALRGVPILGVAGDQQAALFGQGCFAAGQAKSTYGTGAFLLMHTGPTPLPSRHGLLTTLTAQPDGGSAYALEGSVFVAGASIQWLRDELGLLAHAADSEAEACAVADNGGVYLVPAFVGLGAPHWDMEARGTLVGLTRGTNRHHIVRAAVEAMAFQVADVLEAMQEDTGTAIPALSVDGGASANNFLMQFQADVLNVPVQRPANVESTAMGAAFLAGLEAGVWHDATDLPLHGPGETRFTPRMPAAERDALRAGWSHALRQTRTR